jgi:hypothetical protein
MQVSEKHSFARYDCVKIENEALSLWVTRSVGPRIIALVLEGGENLFAELPGASVNCPGVGTYNFRGGHRLWHAPEDPRRTYLPDNDSVEVSKTMGGIQFTQPVEPQTGIQKSMTISLPDQRAQVIVDHHLQNQGKWPIELAPWAITQLKPGGVAILPQISMPVDQFSVLPNRQIALWPYTQANSLHTIWGDRYVFIHANMESGALKIGYPNLSGWLGYALGETLFIKTAVFQPSESYFDLGSSSECYCCPTFLELETLGPRRVLEPGETVSHQETWMLYNPVEFTANELAVQSLVKSLDI